MTAQVCSAFQPCSGQITIGFLTPHNAMDHRSFSGSAYHAARALFRTPGISVRLIGDHHRATRISDRLLRRRTPGPRVSAPDLEGLDMVVGLVASPLLDDLARHSNVPFLHVTDATPAFLREVYGWPIPADADQLERRVAASSASVVYSSAFMASRAARDVGLHGDHMRVIPFGTNLDVSPDLPFAGPPVDQVNLLFVCTDWYRKGGDMAVAALDYLRSTGVNARLTIVGAAPEQLRDHDFVITKGFLDQNAARGRAKLSDLYAQAHVLLLPTRADCTPMVLAEAMSHGTPVLATDTGGVAELIGGGAAGQTLSRFAKAEDWATAIRRITSDPAVWTYAADAAADRARTRYSWDAWAGEIADIARLTLGSDRAQAA